MASITESFSQPIPAASFRRKYNRRPAANVSGPSTERAEAPAFGLSVPLTPTWAPFARVVLENPDVLRSLNDCRLATWEPSRYLLTEADVADAAAVQLMNPVDLAFSAYHLEQTVSGNQHAVPDKGARADKVWHKRSSGDKWYPFAILDYKKAGVICPEELQTACIQPARFAQGAATAAGRQSLTLFGGNAWILLKQAVHYADSYTTKYIAFFDWDTLLLLYLGDQEEISGGTWCCLTVVRDKGDMRQALLGFLERAYQSSVSGEDQLPPIMPAAAAAAAAAGAGAGAGTGVRTRAGAGAGPSDSGRRRR